jgi:hypothetical protein
MMTELTLRGNTYRATFNMKTLISFEEMAGKSFFSSAPPTMKERVAWVIASILSADENAKISFDLFGNIDTLEGLQEVVVAFNKVMEMEAKFFHIPDVEQEKEGEKKKNQEKKGKKGKN